MLLWNKSERYTLFMFKHEKVLWITRTAVLIAIAIALQAVTRLFGSNYITGTVVNMMLIISVMTCGLYTGLTVAAVTPVMATLLGVPGPTWPFIPFIAMGNMVLVSAWFLIGNREKINRYLAYAIALITGAIVKFLVLHFGIVWILMGIRTFNIVALMANPLSVPQMITAAAGGVFAIILIPPLKKALKGRS